MTIAVDWDVKNQTKNLMWVLGFLFISSVILLGIFGSYCFLNVGYHLFKIFGNSNNTKYAEPKV